MESSFIQVNIMFMVKVTLSVIHSLLVP